jgi:hypothetical protein
MIYNNPYQTGRVTLQVRDRLVALGSVLQVSIDGLYDVTDLSASLSYVNQSPVLQSPTLDEREEIVVEREQEPIVLDRVL